MGANLSQPPIRMEGTRGERLVHVLDLMTRVAVVALGAALAIVTLWDPPRWLAVALIGIPALGSLGSIGAAEAVDRRRSRVHEERLRQALGPPCPLLKADPYRVGVHPSERAERFANSSNRPPYVPRSIDPALAGLLGSGDRIILVRGEPLVGKSRTAFEVASQALADHQVVIPHHPGLEVVKDPRRLCQPKVPVLLWFERLEHFLRPNGGITTDWIKFWKDPRNGIRVIGLISDPELRRLEGDSELYRPLRDVLQQLGTATMVIRNGHDAPELARINRLYPGENVTVEGTLGGHLVTADRLLGRFLEARNERAAVFLVTWACAAGQHVIGRSWIDLDLLRALYRTGLQLGLVNSRLLPSNPDAGFAEGLQAAGERLDGLRIPLVREVSPRAFATPHYLEEYVPEHLLPDGGKAQHRFWEAVVRQVDANDALFAGLVAHRRGQVDSARLLFDAAQRSGDRSERATAATSLAVLQLEGAGPGATGRHEGHKKALELLEFARAQGDPFETARADRLSGDVLSRLEQPQAAIKAYQRAIDSGHPDEAVRARLHLGLAYERHGRQQEAEAMLLGAASSHHPDVAPQAALALGNLLEPNDPVAAANWYRKAAQAADPKIASQARSALRRLAGDGEAPPDHPDSLGTSGGPPELGPTPRP